MADMVVQGITALKTDFDRQRRKRKFRRRIWVGYEAEYAIFVHENLTAYHRVGQAKYLEEPARTLQVQIRQTINSALAAGASLDEALYAGGLYLQGESQKLVPVDTGFLRNSAFTLVEIL